MTQPANETISLRMRGDKAAEPGLWDLRIGGGRFGTFSVTWRRKPTEAELETVLTEEMVPAITNEIVNRESSVASAKLALAEAKELKPRAKAVAKDLIAGVKRTTATRRGHEIRE